MMVGDGYAGPEMTNASYKGVLFDLDDTLIDRKSAYDALYRRFYDEQPAIHNDVSWDVAREFFWSLSPWNATNARTAIEEIKRRWPGVESDPERHHRFYFETMIPLMKPLEGAVDLMDRLNGAGIPWGVVTNGDEYQHHKVESTGLKDRIPFVIASKLFGLDKPAPEIYHEAARRLGVDGTSYGELVFVGDNPYTDILGAHGVGMSTAWVKMGREYPGDAPKPDHVIEEPLGVLKLVGL